MIDPRTTNIVGARVRLVRRMNPACTHARGVVRVVDYNQGAFVLLIEATEASDCESWVRMSAGELFQVSLFDETTAVMIEHDAKVVEGGTETANTADGIGSPFPLGAERS